MLIVGSYNRILYGCNLRQNYLIEIEADDHPEVNPNLTNLELRDLTFSEIKEKLINKKLGIDPY